MNRRQLLRRLQRGQYQNVAFSDFRNLVEGFGFQLDRVRGRHQMYSHPSIPRPLDLQERRGEAKAYQLRDFIDLIERYDLRLEE